MRYLTNAQLFEDMVLAMPLRGSNFEILLTEGSVLTENHIRRINELGYPGVYIEDALSEGIVAEDLISSDLRMRTCKAAKTILKKAESGELMRSSSKMPRDALGKLIQPVIDAVLGGQRRMIDIVDLKPYEDYAYYHAANVVVLSILLGVEVGLSSEQLFNLGVAALLHDVGNIFIPKNILNKPSKLTDKEYDVVKRHTELGFDFLREHFDVPIDACIGALQHHENYDGTGYPNQLKKNRISVAGRIIAITDVYDALVSRRPYRQAMYPPEAMAFMAQGAGTLFDPELLEILGRSVARYPSGFLVELTSGVNCIVVNNYPGCPERPRLRLIGNLSRTPMYIDLQNDPAFEDVSVASIVGM